MQKSNLINRVVSVNGLSCLSANEAIHEGSRTKWVYSVLAGGLRKTNRYLWTNKMEIPHELVIASVYFDLPLYNMNFTTRHENFNNYYTPSKV